jgi:hypothetical protein
VIDHLGGALAMKAPILIHGRVPLSRLLARLSCAPIDLRREAGDDLQIRAAVEGEIDRGRASVILVGSILLDSVRAMLADLARRRGSRLVVICTGGAPDPALFSLFPIALPGDVALQPLAG